jgi:hypothetical protein
MTRQELQEKLNEFPADAVIVLSKDAEGNGYSPLADSSESIYVPDTTWAGEIYLTELTDELRQMGYGEGDLYHGDDGQRAVVLWPTN